MVKAVALVAFFRGGQPVEPRTVLDVPDVEFGELQMFNLVDHAPPEPVPVVEVKAVKK